jgi:hypothetical protein
MGKGIFWLPLAISPYDDSIILTGYEPYAVYPNTIMGFLTTSWFYFGFADIDKYYNSVKMMVENTLANTRYVIVDYRKDDSTIWTELFTADALTEEYDFTSVIGKRVQLRFRLFGLTNGSTPRVIGSLIQASLRIPEKFMATVNFLVKDRQLDLLGVPDDYQVADDKVDQLLAWGLQAAPVTVRADRKILDNKSFFINNRSIRYIGVTTQEGVEYMIYQMALAEV